LTELYRPALLDPDKHQREDFACGDAGLDRWLQKFAGQNRRKDFAATWVIADAQYRVAAYATLTMSSLDLSAAPEVLGKSAPRQIPVLLIGRLAVDQRFQRLGVGTTLVRHLLGTAVELNRKAACKAVVVNALNERARTWWEDRFGFTRFSTDPTDFDLYLLTADIEATFQS
jgi:ribosomal protein S18 acetylase RimI-like enzyme